MPTPYRDILKELRLAFPQPVSDPVHDSYFVHSIMRALDQVDAMKTQLPILGSGVTGDFEEARNAALPAHASSVESVTSDLVSYLRGIPIFGHPRTQQNVIPPPTIPSLIGVLLSSLHNANVVWDEFSRLVALAEVEAVGVTARLVGYDPERAAGVFTFGGTGTSLYGVKIGLEKACPQAMQKGVAEDAVVLVSEAGHYCATNVAGWLGIGANNLVVVPTTDDNEMDLARFEEAARSALAGGRKIAAVIAAEIFGNRVRQVSHQQHGIGDAGAAPQPGQLARQDGASVQRQHRLGAIVGQRFHARTAAGGQDYGFANGRGHFLHHRRARAG